MFALFPTGYSAPVHPQPSGQFLLRKAAEPAEGNYSLAKALGLGIIGHIAQELNNPGHKTKGRG